MMKFEQLINQNYQNLSQSDLQILKYIMANKEQCHQLGINALAEKCNVSRTTILRLSKKLGFNGYSEFKVFLKWEESNDNCPKEINQRQLLATSLKETIKMNHNESLLEICQLISDSKRVFVYGTGRAQEICAEELKRMFVYIHKYFNVIKGQLELEASVCDLNADDLIIIISFSGNTPHLQPILNQLTLNDVPIISLTQLQENKLARATTYNLYGSSYEFLLKNNRAYDSTLFLYILIERLFYSYSSYIISKDEE